MAAGSGIKCGAATNGSSGSSSNSSSHGSSGGGGGGSSSYSPPHGAGGGHSSKWGGGGHKRALLVPLIALLVLSTLVVYILDVGNWRHRAGIGAGSGVGGAAGGHRRWLWEAAGSSAGGGDHDPSGGGGGGGGGSHGGGDAPAAWRSKTGDAQAQTVSAAANRAASQASYLQGLAKAAAQEAAARIAANVAELVADVSSCAAACFGNPTADCERTDAAVRVLLANRQYSAAQQAFNPAVSTQLTIYKLYHIRDLFFPTTVSGFDYGPSHGLSWPFGPAMDELPTDPPVRGFRMRGDAPLRADHLDLEAVLPAATDVAVQVQYSEFSGFLAIANALEGGATCVPGHLPDPSALRTPENSVHWTPWIGFTSWKDVKLARIQWDRVFAADAGRSADTLYAFFNVLPECNPRSHRPAPNLCTVEYECHGGAICDPDRHMNVSFPGMHAYLHSVWERTFDAPLPTLPPSATVQYLWSSRFVTSTRAFLAIMRAMRRLLITMEVDFLKSHGQCAFGQYPEFTARNFDVWDPNPPRCLAMAMERFLNYIIVGRGMRTLMVHPAEDCGEYGPPLETQPDDLQPMYQEAWGKSLEYLIALPPPPPAVPRLTAIDVVRDESHMRYL